MNDLLQIEQLSSQITEETKRILENNFPLDSREYLPIELRAIVEQNDSRIVELAKQYLELFHNLSNEEKIKISYQNIRGNYYQQTHQIKGLKNPHPNADEYELSDAFLKAKTFGMEALENLNLAAKTNNEELAAKSQLVLTKCIEVLKVHFWGEPIIEYLNRYKTRLNNGRTIEEDLQEYEQLKEEARMLAIDYARSILNGITDLEKAEFITKFEEIFAKETVLTEFIPSDILKKVYQNLFWMKNDAQKTPEKVIEDSIQYNSSK